MMKNGNGPLLIAVILSIVLQATVVAIDHSKRLGGNLRARYDQEGIQKAFGPQTRVIGGDNVEANERYPYMVTTVATMEGDSLCGGALIAPDIVLTAAHCLNAASSVYVGEYDMTTRRDGADYRLIAEQIVHPSYITDEYGWDAMVMRLNNPVSKQYVRLNSDPSFPRESAELSVIGFGITAFEKTSDGKTTAIFPDILQQATVDYIDNEECDRMYRLSGDEITSDMLCAAADGTDSCSGDSGGPLISNGGDAESDVLVGSTSWGKGCADSRYPGVYARTSYSYDWIVETSCALSRDPPDYFQCQSDLVITQSPSDAPSIVPSLSPFSIPSSAPSIVPSLSPSPVPSDAPSMAPSPSVSLAPSDHPFGAPSIAPSSSPSISLAPSDQPSDAPSIVPSSSPSISLAPSDQPSDAPSIVPSSSPSISLAPSDQPFGAPSITPSSSPSISLAPSDQPSDAPSIVPSSSPSVSQSPSMAPSQNTTETSLADFIALNDLFQVEVTESPMVTDPPAGIEAPTASPKDSVTSHLFLSSWVGLIIFSAPMFFLSL